MDRIYKIFQDLHVHLVQSCKSCPTTVLNRTRDDESNPSLQSLGPRRLPVNLLRDLLEWASVGIDSDDSVEGGLIELSDGATTN